MDKPVDENFKSFIGTLSAAGLQLWLTEVEETTAGAAIGSLRRPINQQVGIKQTPPATYNLKQPPPPSAPAPQPPPLPATYQPIDSLSDNRVESWFFRFFSGLDKDRMRNSVKCLYAERLQTPTKTETLPSVHRA